MMKLRRWMAAAVLLALPVFAWAQVVQQDGSRTDPGRRGTGQGTMIGGIIRSDTTFKVLTMDASGNLKTAEASPAMDAGFTYQSIISNTGIAIGAADSSAIMDTRRMRLGMLLIKAVVAGTGTVDTTCVARLAIQVRTHLNGSADSSSTFGIYQYGVVPANVATTAVADTSQQGHVYSGVPIGGLLATPGSNTSWSGEIVVLVSAKRNAHGDAVSVNGHTFYYPNGIAISLESLFGRAIYSPYTSVRVRTMSVQKGAATLATGTVAVTVHLVGTPL